MEFKNPNNISMSMQDLNLSQATFWRDFLKLKYSPLETNLILPKIDKNLFDQMLKLNMISADEYQQSLTLVSTQQIEINAPHFVMYIKDQPTKELGECSQPAASSLPPL
jgi:hypothetical protein